MTAAANRQPAWKNPETRCTLPEPSAGACDRWYREIDAGWAPVSHRVITELEKLPPGRALDLGCGDGRHAVWLAGRSWQVEALDFSEEALRIGRERAFAEGVSDGVTWTKADARDIAPAPETVDLILAAFLDVPAQSMEQVIARTVAGLVPGGRFLLVGHETGQRSAGAGVPQDDEALASARSACRWLSEAGLLIESFGTYPRVVPGESWPAIDHIVVARGAGPHQEGG
ncbi:class I SAM-dependent methyltransferase [Arthrobacter antioxidans]|uniref:class I SAM-dependent methyltransferase n=1 Tax=Arthrobacter antioxidans TaxID=2895818 RepID=UPI001FFF4BFA|nr:class I SAM-dependent methyltransferase [Arthrobacter antioxidans]